MWTKKTKITPEMVLTSFLTWLLINLNSLLLNASLCHISSVVSSHLEKQNEILHNTLGFMAAELADVEDSSHLGEQCTAHSQMQLKQIWMSSFSLQINS